MKQKPREYREKERGGVERRRKRRRSRKRERTVKKICIRSFQRKGYGRV